MSLKSLAVVGVALIGFVVMFALGQTPASAPPAASEGAAKATAAQIDSVIELVKAGLSEGLIIKSLQKNNKPVNLNMADMVKLKNAGVSEDIISIMLDPAGAPVMPITTSPKQNGAEAPPVAPVPVAAAPGVPAVPAVKQSPLGPTSRWLSVFPVGQQVYGIQADQKDPNILYACTNHGLFRSTDAGMTWLPLFNGDATFLALAQAKTSPNVMYLGLTNGRAGQVLASTDNGSTWRRIGAEDIQHPVDRIDIDPVQPGTVYIVSNSALYKTSNGGRTWANVAPDVSAPHKNFMPERELSLFAVDPQKSDHLFANYGVDQLGRTSNLWESTDGGLSWQPRPKAMFVTPNKWNATNWRSLFFHPSDGNELAGTIGGEAWGGDRPPVLALSHDAGGTWQDARIPEKVGTRDTANMLSFVWSLKQPGLLYGGTLYSLYTSTDQGQNWKRVLPYRTTDLIELGTGELYAATSAGVLKSRNSGRTWHLSGIGLPTASGNADVFDAFQQGQGTNLFQLDAVEGKTIFVGGRGGYWESQDGGVSWSWRSIPSDLTAGISGDLMPQNSGPNVRQILAAKDHTLFVNLVSQGAFASGESQVLKIQPDGKVTKINSRRMPNMIGFSPGEPTILYMTAGEGVGSFVSPAGGRFFMRSDDAGFSWETSDLSRGLRARTQGFAIAGIPSFAVSSSSSKVVYVLIALRNQQFQNVLALQTTTDGAATWHDVFPDLLVGQDVLNSGVVNASLTIDPRDPKIVYLTLNGKVFRTSDAGARWTEIKVPVAVNGIAVSSQSSQLIYAATTSGAWISVNAGAFWTPLNTGSLVQDNLKTIISLGELTMVII
jgi:photosystem II stability/assembly factor-like uncharacterized protein